jgi:hypothetical protein
VLSTESKAVVRLAMIYVDKFKGCGTGILLKSSTRGWSGLFIPDVLRPAKAVHFAVGFELTVRQASIVINR